MTVNSLSVIKKEDENLLLFFLEIKVTLQTLTGLFETERYCYIGDSTNVNSGKYKYVPVNIQVAEFKDWILKLIDYINSSSSSHEKNIISKIIDIKNLKITDVKYVIVRLEEFRGFLARIPVHVKKTNNQLLLYIGSDDFHARIADRPVTEHANSIDRLLTRAFNQRIVFNE